MRSPARAVLLACSLCAAACAPPAQSESGSLPILHPFDATRAEHGRSLLEVETVTQPSVPRVGLENLWVVWPGGYSGDYWTAFRERYGMHEAPFENAGLPLGLRTVGKNVSFDCLLCHGSTVAGQVVLGVANSTLDVQGLLDDLEAAAKLAGITAPVLLRNRTGAAGAIDAVGMGFAFGERIYGAQVAGLNKECGFERAPAWWQLKHKRKVFNDGSSEAPSFRTMAGTLLADGLTIDEIALHAADFEDIGHWILSLNAPPWPFGELDRARWDQGRAVFQRECSTCHGIYHGADKSFPDRILPVAEIGTDPVRTMKFGAPEVNAINSTWFGDPPMVDTDGYLAPTLIGIWARAPYLHNGSVPDLVSVLDSKSRPAVWQRIGIGKEHFDAERVGWRYSTPAERGDPKTIEGRKIYDTAREGLSNSGHTYGDGLSEVDRAAVLEYLKSL